MLQHFCCGSVSCSQLTGVSPGVFSAAVAQLLQGWSCCVFRDALL